MFQPVLQVSNPPLTKEVVVTMIRAIVQESVKESEARFAPMGVLLGLPEQNLRQRAPSCVHAIWCGALLVLECAVCSIWQHISERACRLSEKIEKRCLVQQSQINALTKRWVLQSLPSLMLHVCQSSQSGPAWWGELLSSSTPNSRAM